MKGKILLNTAFLLAILQPLVANAQYVNTQDSLALIDLYDSTHGDNWVKKNNWKTSSPVVTWYGVITGNGRVTKLNLTKNNLVGTLPASLGGLTELTYFDFSANNLGTNIPPTLGNLVKLELFNLDNNALVGTIPNELGNLVNLTFLGLGNNPNITGSIPSSLGNLINLTELNLAGGGLTGSIPESFGNFTKLVTLRLSENKLGGTIPPSLGNLTQLTFLNIGVNEITGPIPPELGNLTNLTTFYAGRNQLTGQIPSTLGNLSKLTILEFVYNNLTGPVPSSLDACPLQFLSLSFNQLSDSLPYSVFHKTYSNALQISNNKFTFAGMEGINYGIAGTLIMSPQANIPIHKNGNVLSVSAGGTLFNNTYKWYQNGFLIATNTGDSSLDITSPGLYNVDVQNTIVGDRLILHSNDITVTTLPLTLLSFIGSADKNIVNLQWQTTNEIGTKSFVIQKLFNNTPVTNIGTVVAKNKVGTHQYSFNDEHPAAGENFYRLQMIDKDGLFNYSKTISVKNGSGIRMQVYPNPMTNVAVVLFNANSISKYSITVTDMLGNPMQTITGTSVQGLNKVNINMHDYAKGSYIISIVAGDYKQNIQMIKGE